MALRSQAGDVGPCDLLKCPPQNALQQLQLSLASFPGHLPKGLGCSSCHIYFPRGPYEDGGIPQIRLTVKVGIFILQHAGFRSFLSFSFFN